MSAGRYQKYSYEYSALSKVGIHRRNYIKISSRSKFGDRNWDLGEFETNPNVKPSDSILRWDFRCVEGHDFSSIRYENLCLTFKELIYTLAASPIGKVPSPATLKKKYTSVRTFMNWLVVNDYRCLSWLTPQDLNEYIQLVLSDSEQHPSTKVNKLEAVGLFWECRKSLSFSLKFDPLNGKKAFSVSGVTRKDLSEHKYEFIPDDIAQHLIRSCVGFIRERGVLVAAAAQSRERASLDKLKQGRSRPSRVRARKQALEGLNISNAEVTAHSRQILASCYLIIGFFTGLRASELLSMKPDEITIEDGTVYVQGQQHKIDKKPNKWMAPDIVLEAHNLAKALTQPMREAIEYEIENTTDVKRIRLLKELGSCLFLNWSSKRKYGLHFEHAPKVSNISSSIQTSLKELVRIFGVVEASGCYWNLHQHQLRKTFVRFMCANAMNIRYLQEHMGHRSLDMTAWYDSDDIELTRDIIQCMSEFKKQKLVSIFRNDQKTAGSGAELIERERQDYFAGMASQRDRESFLSDLAEDITMRSTGHSWCLGDSSNGDCTGVVGCMMDITMTQKCKSALITEEHLPAWLDIKRRNEELLHSTEIGKYQKEAISRVISETIKPTIRSLRSSQQEISNGRE